MPYHTYPDKEFDWDSRRNEVDEWKVERQIERLTTECYLSCK